LVKTALQGAQTAFAEDRSETGQMLRRTVFAAKSSAGTEEPTPGSGRQPMAEEGDIPAILAELNRAQVEHLSAEEREILLARALHLRKRSQGRYRQALTELMHRLAIDWWRSRQGGEGLHEAAIGPVSNNRDLQALASTAWFTIAEQAIGRGGWELATDSADCSLELLRILCDANDAKSAWLCDYARGLTLKGELYLEQDQVAAAKHAFEHARAKYERLVKLEPQQPLFLRGLAVTCDKLGDMARAADHLDSADGAYQQALLAFRQAARVDPDFLRDLSLCLAKIGELGLAREDLASAKKALGEHFMLATRIASADPGDMEHQRDLAGAHGRMSQLAMATEDFSAAMSHTEAAHRIVDAVAAADRSNVRWQQDLAGSLFNFGMLLAQSGDSGRGLKMVSQSYKMLIQMASLDRLDTKGRNLLQHIRRMLADNR
jgi:tetratricopeptide (TPR) repeat protein